MNWGPYNSMVLAPVQQMLLVLAAGSTELTESTIIDRIYCSVNQITCSALRQLHQLHNQQEQLHQQLDQLRNRQENNYTLLTP